MAFIFILYKYDYKVLIFYIFSTIMFTIKFMNPPSLCYGGQDKFNNFLPMLCCGRRARINKCFIAFEYNPG